MKAEKRSIGTNTNISTNTNIPLQSAAQSINIRNTNTRGVRRMRKKSIK